MHHMWNNLKAEINRRSFVNEWTIRSRYRQEHAHVSSQGTIYLSVAGGRNGVDCRTLCLGL